MPHSSTSAVTPSRGLNGPVPSHGQPQLPQSEGGSLTSGRPSLHGPVLSTLTEQQGPVTSGSGLSQPHVHPGSSGPVQNPSPGLSGPVPLNGQPQRPQLEGGSLASGLPHSPATSTLTEQQGPVASGSGVSQPHVYPGSSGPVQNPPLSDHDLQINHLSSQVGQLQQLVVDLGGKLDNLTSLQTEVLTQPRRTPKKGTGDFKIARASKPREVGRNVMMVSIR